MLVYFNYTLQLGDSEFDWLVTWEYAASPPVSEPLTPEQEERMGKQSIITSFISGTVFRVGREANAPSLFGQKPCLYISTTTICNGG